VFGLLKCNEIVFFDLSELGKRSRVFFAFCEHQANDHNWTAVDGLNGAARDGVALPGPKKEPTPLEWRADTVK
jgi:hypothetical protein